MRFIWGMIVICNLQMRAFVQFSVFWLIFKKEKIINIKLQHAKGKTQENITKKKNKSAVTSGMWYLIDNWYLVVCVCGLMA